MGELVTPIFQFGVTGKLNPLLIRVPAASVQAPPAYRVDSIDAIAASDVASF